MAEQYSSNFEIDVSGELQDTAISRGVEFVPHLGNLLALAESVGTPIPEEPRVLLLAYGQRPHTDRILVMESPGVNHYLPKYSPGDIVASLPTLRLTNERITQSIAMALAEQRRRQQTLLLNRFGGAALASGAAVSGVGELALQHRAIALAGWGLFAAGLVALGFAHNRSDVRLPKNIDWSLPPITLEPLPEHPS